MKHYVRRLSPSFVKVVIILAFFLSGCQQYGKGLIFDDSAQNYEGIVKVKTSEQKVRMHYKLSYKSKNYYQLMLMPPLSATYTIIKDGSNLSVFKGQEELELQLFDELLTEVFPGVTLEQLVGVLAHQGFKQDRWSYVSSGTCFIIEHMDSSTCIEVTPR